MFLLLAVIAVAAELLLRFNWPQIFPIYEPGMLSPHPVLGHALTPNFKGSLSRTDFRIDVHINGQGLRGPDLRARTKTTVSILCLGDSMTWGWGVAADKAFPAVLGSKLQTHYAGIDIRMINAGIPFSGTIDEVAFLKSRIAEFEPDIVILQFNAVDDFEQNRAPSHERQKFDDGMLRSTPEFEWSRGPVWLTLLNRAKHRSHLVRLLSETAGQALMRANMLSPLESVSSNFFSGEEAETAKQLLTEVAALATQANANTLFVYAPEKMQVLAKPATELRAAELVREVAESVGAGYVDLTPASVARNNIEAQFSKAEGYWTVSGHQMIASQLFQEIVDKRLIDESR